MKVYEIGQAYIRLDIRVNEDFKHDFEKYLLYLGKKYTSEFYNKELLEGGLYFSIELEDGSLISRLKFYGKIAIGALIGYGGIRTGVDYIIRDSRAITEHIAETISNDPNIGNRISRVERRLGVPGKIKRLYSDINKLQNNRDNLTENEQDQLIEKIQRSYEDLMLELDQQEIQPIQQDIVQLQIPLPVQDRNEAIEFPRMYVIREDEIRLISEDEIEDEPRELPQHNE